MRIWVVLFLLAVAGCAHHAPKGDCEGHLTPINPPNPVLKSPTDAPKS